MRGILWGVVAAVGGLLCAGALYSQTPAPAPPPLGAGVKASPKALPPEITVYAASPNWQPTGVHVDPSAPVRVVYQYGRWATLPGQDTSGVGYLFWAPAGYVLPGVAAGSLIGRVGGPGGTTFCLGNDGYVPQGLSGELELIANDDIDQATGAGFSDNTGFIVVKVYVSTR